MSKMSVLLTGVIIGFVAAHYANQTPEGRRMFERLNQGAREFSDAVASGYHEVEVATAVTFDEVAEALRGLDNK